MGKSADECQAHYLATYIEHDQFPLPKRDASMAHVSTRPLTLHGVLRRLQGQSRTTTASTVVGPSPSPLALPGIAAAAARAGLQHERRRQGY